MRLFFSLLFLVATCGQTFATDSTTLSLAYQQLLDAQHSLIQNELTLERHRLSNFENLLEQGHASWLETRKQKLTFEKLSARCRTFQEFNDDVQDILRGSDELSLRWIGNLRFTDLNIELSNRIDVSEWSEILSQRLIELRQANAKLAKQIKSLSDLDSWRKPLELELAIKQQKAEVLSAHIRLLASTNFAAHPNPSKEANHSLDEVSRLALLKQCESHGRLLNHLLQREQFRLDNLKSLAKDGIGSQRDIQSLSDRVHLLQRQNDFQDSVAVYLEGVDTKNTQEHYVGLNSKSTFDWIQNRFDEAEARFQLKSAELDKAMLTEVLTRLESAAASAQSLRPNTLAKKLAEGQQNELNNYRWQIKKAELLMELAESRLNANGTSNAMKGFVFKLPKPTQTTFASTFAGLGAMLSAPSEPTITRFAAVSHLVDTSLLDVLPSRFLDISSHYRPTSLLDFGKVSQSYRRPISLKQSSAYARYRDLTRRNMDNARRNYYPALATMARPALPRFEQAYYFGILRPELRSFLPVGQPPWYLPGSPTNLRYRQLRSDYRRDVFGRTGNDLLRTRIYTDIYGRY